ASGQWDKAASDGTDHWPLTTHHCPERAAVRGPGAGGAAGVSINGGERGGGNQAVRAAGRAAAGARVGCGSDRRTDSRAAAGMVGAAVRIPGEPGASRGPAAPKPAG